MQLRTMAAAGHHLPDPRHDRPARRPEARTSELLAARRIAVMINKYWTAIAATATARDGIEVLGGNGTIEDFSVLPRLYRDAIVVESWEGTHNTLCAQVLRDFASPRAPPPVARAMLDARSTRSRNPSSQGPRRRSRGLTSSAHDRATAGRGARTPRRTHPPRWWTGCAGSPTGSRSPTQADWDLEHIGSSDCLDALELYRLNVIDGADPQDHPELVELWRRMSREP